LALLNCLHVFAVHGLGVNSPVERRLFRQVSLNDEQNISTFYAALLLLAAGALLAIVAKQTESEKKSRYWAGLSAVFLLLAFDEAATLHEEVTYLINKLSNRGLVNTGGGYLQYSWVIPYTVGLAVLSAYYARFIWQLPSKTRNQFVAAGCVFVTGAVGLETLEGHYDLIYGMQNLYTALLCIVEEVMEMGGVVLFIYALLSYMAQQHGSARWRVAR
jgi:hypothetical protein